MRTHYALIVSAIREAGGTADWDADGGLRLFEDAGLDSLMLMNTIQLIQQKCQVQFAPEDFSPEQFATIHDVAALVEARAKQLPRG